MLDVINLSAFLFGVFFKQNKVGSLAPIATVMLPEALHLCVGATFEWKAGIALKNKVALNLEYCIFMVVNFKNYSMYLPKFFKNLVPLIIVLFIMVSCTKEEPIIIEENTEITNTSSTVKALMEMEGDEAKSTNACFDFVFPIKLNFEDEKQQSIASFEELSSTFEKWYAENKGKDNKELAFIYPLEVSFSNGTVKEIQSNKELIALIIGCKDVFDDKDHNELKDNCFEINYPVTVVFEDKSTLVINDLEEHKAAVEDQGKGKSIFVFPIEVIFKEDKRLEVKSQDDLDKLYKDCKEKWYEEDKEEDDKLFDFTGGYSDCFQINYPVSLIIWDGTVTTLSDAEEARNWVNSPEFDKHTFQFPIEIIFKNDYDDEKVVTINSEGEWIRIRNSCNEDDKDWEHPDWDEGKHFAALFFDCFEVSYPIRLYIGDGNSQVVNNQEEVIELMRATGRAYFKVAFPIRITFDGDEKEIVTNVDLVKLIVEKCIHLWEDDKNEDDWDEGDHEDWGEVNWEREIELLGIFSDCFQINYPLTLILADGTTKAVSSIDEMAEVVRSADRQTFAFQFPIKITIEEVGANREINSTEELNEIVKSCLDNWQDDREDSGDIWGAGNNLDWANLDWLDFNWVEIDWDDIDWEEDFRDIGFFEDCFKFNYPISISFENRGELTVNNDMEFKRIIASVFQDFLNEDNRIGSSEVNYPLDVTLDDGSIETINNNEELWKMVENCK